MPDTKSHIILVLPNKLTEIIQQFFNLHIFKIRVVSLEHCQVQTTSSVMLNAFTSSVMLNAFTSSVEAADFNPLVGVQQKPL
jgi:hypothetical protein